MDRNQAKEFYPILQAFAEGKVIETRTDPSTLKRKDTPNRWAEMKEIESITIGKPKKGLCPGKWLDHEFFIIKFK